jgi:hypothetical protein
LCLSPLNDLGRRDNIRPLSEQAIEKTSDETKCDYQRRDRRSARDVHGLDKSAVSTLRQTRATMPHVFRAQTHFGPHARIHPELSGGNGCDGSGGSFMLSIQATVLLIESKDVRLSMALFAVIFIHACLDKGQILTYLGWVKPRRKVYWIYAAWQVHLEHALLSSFCTEHVFLWARRRQRNCCAVLPWGRLSRKQFFAERHSQQYNICHRLLEQTAGALADRTLDRCLFPALCLVSHACDWRSVDGHLWDGSRLCSSPPTSALMQATYNCVIAIAMIHPAGV